MRQWFCSDFNRLRSNLDRVSHNRFTKRCCALVAKVNDRIYEAGEFPIYISVEFTTARTRSPDTGRNTSVPVLRRCNKQPYDALFRLSRINTFLSGVFFSILCKLYYFELIPLKWCQMLTSQWWLSSFASDKNKILFPRDIPALESVSTLSIWWWKRWTNI